MQLAPLEPNRATPRAGGAAASHAAARAAFWVAALVLLAAPPRLPAVRRTQEARVLETAREMLGAGFRGWMIPHLNGAPRLQKPPLAYWLAAGSFKLFGTSAWAGRVPVAAAGWGTLVVTFAAGRWVAGARVGWMAAAGLLGSYLFAKHAQLAETDGLATVFVTAGIYATRRGAGRGRRARARPAWHLTGAAAIGLAFMAKGAPGLFPLLFLVALAVERRRLGVLRDWCLSGAPLVLLAIALPWYGYVIHAVGFETFRKEIHAVVGGEDHGGSFLAYGPALVAAVAPWPIVIGWAIGRAVGSLRRDAKSRGLLLWAAAILLPLCVAGNKQSHYLMPLAPPLMLLAARNAGAAIRRGGVRRGLEVVLWATLAGAAVGAAGIGLAPRFALGHFRGMDVAIGAALLLGACGAAQAFARRGTVVGLGAIGGLAALAMPLLCGVWIPSLNVTSARVVAADLRARYGGGPYCFVADGPYLPLCFEMREVIPTFKLPAQAAPWLAAAPGRLALLRGGEMRSPHADAGLGEAFVRLGTVGARDEEFHVYRLGTTLPDAGRGR